MLLKSSLSLLLLISLCVFNLVLASEAGEKDVAKKFKGLKLEDQHAPKSFEETKAITPSQSTTLVTESAKPIDTGIASDDTDSQSLTQDTSSTVSDLKQITRKSFTSITSEVYYDENVRFTSDQMENLMIKKVYFGGKYIGNAVFHSTNNDQLDAHIIERLTYEMQINYYLRHLRAQVSHR